MFLETLKAHPFSAPIADQLIELARERSYAADEPILQASREADQVVLLLSGHVALEIGGKVLQTLGPGEVLGVSWLEPPYRWKWDARAVEPSRAIVLDAAPLRQKLARDSAFAAHVYRAMTHALSQRLEAARLQMLDLYRSPR